nr:hypothetical protein [Tanacetum cinerariifolium]
MPAANTYSRADAAVLNTRQTPIKKQPETLLCLVELSRRYFLGDDVYPTFLHDNDQGRYGSFNLISAPNPSKVKAGLRPRAAHEVPLLTATASPVIDMEDPDVATESSGTSSAVETSPLDFDNENPSLLITKGKGTEDQAHETVAPKIPLLGNMPATGAASEVSRRRSFEIPIENVDTMEVQDTRSAKSAGSRKSTSSPSMIRSPEDIYQPGWCVTNSCRLNTPDACQDVVDHIVPPGEEEIKKLDQEIHGLQNQTSNLKTLLEAEADMKKVAETKNADLTKELESLLTGEERIKAAFEEFKKLEDDRVEKRCAEMDARLDALSIDFDEELYPHMLTAIAGISKGISEDLAYGIEHGKADRGLEVVEAYDPEANNKYLQALQEMKDLKYQIVDQLQGLKDPAIEVIMASLHLESDSREDAPKWIHDIRPSTSQLKILVYSEKKRCRVVCRTHEIGSAHHARSDGVPVSVHTVAPQGLAILLADAATQTETSSPRLLRSKSLPPMCNLDWL